MRSNDGLERPRAKRLETRKGEGLRCVMARGKPLTLSAERRAPLAEPQALSHRERDQERFAPMGDAR